MKIAIFGSTGRTGNHLVEQALEAGYEVTAFTRSSSKLGLRHERLRVVEGDIQEKARVEEAVRGADAVISVLGPVHNRPGRDISRGTANILEAMQACGVSRLVISAGAGVRDPADSPALFDHLIGFLLKLAARNVYEDMKQAVGLVRSSDREWTVVRVPMLTDGPKTGEVKIGYVGKGMGPRIRRADMACFILKQVEERKYLRQAPVISN